MKSKRTFLRENYGLRKNPFPSDAILMPGVSGEPKDDGSLFNPDVIPDKVGEFLEKCIGDSLETNRSFTYLWSVAPGGDARGYGKTSLLKYVARRVNQDFGRGILSKIGYDDDEINENPIIAAYASFDKNRVTNFNAVLFEHVQYLAEPEPNMLVRLRQRILNGVSSEPASVEADTNAAVSAIRNAFYTTRGQLGPRTLGPVKVEWVWHLLRGESQAIINYLHGIAEWHRIRNGSVFMDGVLTLAKAAKIKKVFLFVDQLEDLASSIVPYNKRAREVERFRDIAVETQPFAGMTSFIVTLHPPAAQAIEQPWELARLPSFDYTNPANQNRIVRLRELNSEEAIKLAETYINSNEYRIDRSLSPLHPFEPEAIVAIWEHANKRPGTMLPLASTVLDKAAAENIEIIDQAYVSQALSGVSAEIPAKEVELAVAEAQTRRIDIADLLR